MPLVFNDTYIFNYLKRTDFFFIVVIDIEIKLIKL